MREVRLKVNHRIAPRRHAHACFGRLDEPIRDRPVRVEKGSGENSIPDHDPCKLHSGIVAARCGRAMPESRQL